MIGIFISLLEIISTYMHKGVWSKYICKEMQFQSKLVESARREKQKVWKTLKGNW